MPSTRTRSSRSLAAEYQRHRIFLRCRFEIHDAGFRRQICDESVFTVPRPHEFLLVSSLRQWREALPAQHLACANHQ